jgi:hypothetical protein
MTEEQLTDRLDDLMREMIRLIDEAEDANKIPPHLTFHLAIDGCKVFKEWEETEEGLKKIEPILIFDNTLNPTTV